MQTLIILGAGQFGRSITYLINKNQIEILAFGDNNQKLWHTNFQNIPILSIKDAIKLQSDYCLISVSGFDRIESLKKQAIDEGFKGQFIVLSDLIHYFDIRSATLYYIAQRINEQKIDGETAELGVYKGDIAHQINALFPNKKLYLFDTFTGFDKRDIDIEKKNQYSRGQIGDFQDTSITNIMKRMPYPENVIIKQGYFPDTTNGLDDLTFSFVSLDADLYQPILAGLNYFYPRLNSGGMILLHDYNNLQFTGAHQAVIDFEKQYGSIIIVPLSDMHGSCVIVKA
ncbi:MAG: TylF/MycF family methyltransferase [Erysipelotrichaceae bacterium]|nr:TylF/MycF family methyltransferase [Erysipelotrichaceae bacterium]